MYRYLIGLIASIAVLIAFSLLVFKGKSSTFSLQEHKYIQQFEKIKSTYWKELTALEVKVQKVIKSRRNQKIIDVILKQNKLITRNFKIGKKNLNNLIILNKYNQIIYVQDRSQYHSSYKNGYKAAKENNIFIAPNGNLAIKRAYSKKYSRGFIIFEFSLADILKKVFAVNGYPDNPNNYIYYDHNLIYHFNEVNKLPLEFKKKLTECHEVSGEFCKFYFPKEKKYLISTLLSENGVRASFMYNSNISGISSASIFIFILLFVIIILLFIFIFFKQQYNIGMGSLKSWLDKTRNSLPSSPPKVDSNITNLFEEINAQETDSLAKQANPQLTPAEKLTNSMGLKVKHDDETKPPASEPQTEEKPVEKFSINQLEDLIKPNEIKKEEIGEEFKYITEPNSVMPDDNEFNDEHEEKLNQLLQNNQAENTDDGPTLTNNVVEEVTTEKDLDEDKLLETLAPESTINIVEELTKEASAEEPTEPTSEIPPVIPPVPNKNYHEIAKKILQNREKFLKLDSDKREKAIFKILKQQKIKFALMFNFKIDHFYVGDSLGIKTEHINQFNIYQDQSIYQKYFIKNQGVLIKNDKQQSQFLQAYFDPKTFAEIPELFFLPIQNEGVVENIIAFN